MALLVAPTALDSVERGYLDNFDFIIILCPTLKYNDTYCQQKWFWNDPYIIPIEPGDSVGNHLYNWIEKLAALLAGHKTSFLIDNIIANKTLNK